MELPNRTQVTIAPRCPECESVDVPVQRSQRISGGLNHNGRQHEATKQYRLCRVCGCSFPVIKIGAVISRVGRGRVTGPAAPIRASRSTRPSIESDGGSGS